MAWFRREAANPDRYPGYPITGSRQRRTSHGKSGADHAADVGQAWEDGDRDREHGRGRRRR